MPLSRLAARALSTNRWVRLWWSSLVRCRWHACTLCAVLIILCLCTSGCGAALYSDAAAVYLSVSVAPGGEVEMLTPLPGVPGVTPIRLPAGATVADLKSAISRADASVKEESVAVVEADGDEVSGSSPLAFVLGDDFRLRVGPLTMQPVYDAVSIDDMRLRGACCCAAMALCVAPCMWCAVCTACDAT
jgi:hypothetical protein